MKTFPHAFLCLLLLFIGRAYAQETFAPLITENTVAFVHIDFNTVELDAIKETLQKTGENILKELGFDDRSFKATARELNVELEKLDMLARPAFDTITKELGIREIAYIADMELVGHGTPVIWVIPWKNKTDKHFETLVSLLQLKADDFFTAGDFLIGDESGRIATTEAAVKRWLTQGGAKESPILDALKSVAGREIKFAVALPEQARGMLRNAPLPPDVPAEFRNFLLFAAQKIEWASASISLHDILGTDAPENTDVLLTVKTPRPTDANMLRGMMENLIELGINAGRFAAEMQLKDENSTIPPLAFQFVKGLLRTLLPDVEGDKLVFRVKGVSTQVILASSGISIGLLLPAVKAAREAARQMQCKNNIKQIVLAIHRYHNALGVLPPLYTVDANGKPLHSWRVLILPYMEQVGLYESIRLDEPWDSEYNKQFHDAFIPQYTCPGNPGRGCTYSAIAGEGFVPNKQANSREEHTFANITDGTSNTIAVIEVKEAFNWMDPTADITLDELVKGINVGRAGSFHPYGTNVGFFDGSVRFLTQTVDKDFLRAIGTVRGGENVAR